MTEHNMTIIEAMKELKLIVKKMGHNVSAIQQYSAQPSNEIPYLQDAEVQRQEIAALAQSGEDLAARYAELSARIAYTNLITKVEIGGKTKSIHEWLQFRRKLIKGTTAVDRNSTGNIKAGIEMIYQAMNDALAQQKINTNRVMNTDVTITRFYDEREKMANLRKWMEIYENIDSRLEVVNATTPLAELPGAA